MDALSQWFDAGDFRGVGSGVWQRRQMLRSDTVRTRTDDSDGRMKVPCAPNRDARASFGVR
eukprot:1179857-Prorocentrum_minimum.AAC.2